MNVILITDMRNGARDLSNDKRLLEDTYEDHSASSRAFRPFPAYQPQMQHVICSTPDVAL